ncbi:MAG: hypothetical protein ACRC17_07295 [Culicoidibacterales bacterium]
MGKTENYKLLGIIGVIIALIFVCVLNLNPTKEIEATADTTAFFTVPVHVIVPESQYVKTYEIQTNERVNLRNMLAFHNIAIFADETIAQVNEYDQQQKFIRSFTATNEQPFYIRVTAKSEMLLQSYQALVERTRELPTSYLATDGIEIIIEQPLYDSETATTTFLTTAQVQQIIQQKSFELMEVSITPEAETDETEATEEVVTTPEETIVCGSNEELVNGACQAKPPVCGSNEELVNGACQTKPPVCGSNEGLVNGACQAKPPVCGSNEELVNGACQTKPPVCGSNEELVNGACQAKPPVCGSNEELVNGACQAKPPVCGSNEELVNGVCQTKPPVCNDNETLVDGVCQVTPSEEDEVLDNQNSSETLDENDDVLDTEHQDEN